MESRHKGTEFLREFREFITFLGSLWGLLAGISVFFPLSSVLVEAIPLQKYGVNDGVYNMLSPELITTVATIITLFIVLSTFGSREAFRGDASAKRSARRQAWISMGTAMAALVVYFAIHHTYSEYGYDVFGLGSDDPRKLLFEVPLMFVYAAFFSLLTRAFMLLGMSEFYKNESLPR